MLGSVDVGPPRESRQSIVRRSLRRKSKPQLTRNSGPPVESRVSTRKWRAEPAPSPGTGLMTSAASGGFVKKWRVARLEREKFLRCRDCGVETRRRNPSTNGRHQSLIERRRMNGSRAVRVWLLKRSFKSTSARAALSESWLFLRDRVRRLLTHVKQDPGRMARSESDRKLK